MKLVNKWLKNVQNWALPPSCILCGAPGQPELDLCPACQADLPRIAHACTACGLPLPAEATTICGECLQTPPPYQHCLSPYFYRPPLSPLITQFKFHQRQAIARILARLMGDALQNQTRRPEVIIPVPLHPRRLRERGYNQALEIARLLGHDIDIPVDYHLCQRRRHTPAQIGLSAQARKRNLKNAFSLTGPCPYRHVAILDDVITTGQTVSELARVLRRYGAKEIEVWSVARAVVG